jgi:hypothetical protein
VRVARLWALEKEIERCRRREHRGPIVGSVAQMNTTGAVATGAVLALRMSEEDIVPSLRAVGDLIDT